MRRDSMTATEKALDLITKRPGLTAKMIARISKMPIGTASSACFKLKGDGAIKVLDKHGGYGAARFALNDNQDQKPIALLTTGDREDSPYHVEDATVIHTKEGRIEVGVGDDGLNLMEIRSYTKDDLSTPAVSFSMEPRLAIVVAQAILKKTQGM